MSDTTLTAPTAAKKELETTAERTFAGKTYTPATDIFESDKALTLVMDMPGVRRESIQVRLESHLLEIEGPVEVPEHQGKALYSEYNIGNFYRRFTVSNKIARDGIVAKMADGVLTLTLPKLPEATPRRIAVH